MFPSLSPSLSISSQNGAMRVDALSGNDFGIKSVNSPPKESGPLLLICRKFLY